MLENNEQPSKFTVCNSAQKAQLCKRSGNRQCLNEHSGVHLADFGPITTKSGFIMATSWLNCAIVDQNCVGIGPDSAISVGLCLLCHVGSAGRLPNWAIGAELEAANVKNLPTVYDHWAMTAARTLVIQSSAVITRSNLSWYCIWHCDNNSRKWIRVSKHNRHPIPRRHGRAMRCRLWGFWRKSTAL